MRDLGLLCGLLCVLTFSCSTESGRAASETTSESLAKSVETYRLAFNVLEHEQADDYDVYVMELDGSEPRNITRSPGVEWVYSGAGNRLYAVSDRGEQRRDYRLYEIREIDGRWDWRKIAHFPVSDSWIGVRNGGAELAVASKKDGQPDLYLIDRDGVELRRLTDDPARDRDPAFSPDGKRLVWSSNRSGIDELWILDLATNESRQLTHYPEELLPMDGHGYHAGPPVWSAALDRISYCSKRNGVNAIFTIRPDGSDPQQITDGPQDRCWHSWSPDGRYLAFDGTDENGNYDIYLRDMTSGRTTRLTEGPRTEQGPVFVVTAR